jgi:glycosyltransferase involved in cell wall biosynthesis
VWKRAAGFVATTSGILESFAAAHGARSRTRVIPNGTDVPADRTWPGLARETPPRVLYAGQLYPWKGVDVLVRAMASVPDARLVILGGLAGEADARRIAGIVEDCGLASRTEMRGTVPPTEVAQELARAAVVVAPFLHTAMSERHTSPLKAFEALAAGRPLVASDLPASREFLRDEENALLVPPGEVGALAAALRRVLQTPALAERLGRTGYAEAPRFSWAARAESLRGLFAEVRA